MATRPISAVTTHSVCREKSERVAAERMLVRRVQQGDEEAFATLFQLHRQRVYSVCLSMTKDASEAEDLTQEAFLQVFRSVKTFRGDSAFSTWLYRLAVNIALLKRRRQKFQPMLSLDAPLSSDSTSLHHGLSCWDPALCGAIDRISLRRAIEALPRGYRKVLGLYELHGYQHHEIAELLHCSISTSKSQLHHARMKMRHLLSRHLTSTAAHAGIPTANALAPAIRPRPLRATADRHPNAVPAIAS